jgi:hypothetical protein
MNFSEHIYIDPITEAVNLVGKDKVIPVVLG